MPTTDAQKRARNKWNSENMTRLYDRASILFPKGDKDKIQAHADKRGESLNGFVNRAINETMERDNEKDAQL